MANPQSALPTCAICLGELPLEEAVHPHNPPVGGGCLYHENCLRRWLARRASCPTCRKPSTGPVRNPIFSRCASFRALAGRKLVILAFLIATIVLASCASLGTLLVYVPAPRTAAVVGQNAGLEVQKASHYDFDRRDFEETLELYDAASEYEKRSGSFCRGNPGTCLVRRGRFLCDSNKLSRCRPIDEAAVKLPADRRNKAFELVAVTSAVIIFPSIVYGRQIRQELLSQYEGMVVDVNQETARIVRQEGQNAAQEAANNANQALAATTRVILENARRAVQETAATAAGEHEAAMRVLTDQHAAAEAATAAREAARAEAARAENDRLRSRLQTLEPQLKISRAEVEVLTARVKEEAAAKATAEANARREAAARAAAEATARRQAAAATMANAARREAAAAEAQAAETERRAELLARDEAARREAEQAAAARAVATDRHSVGDQGVEKAKSETPNNVRRVSFDETERNSVVRSTPVEGETSRASSPKPKKRSWYSRVRDVVFAPPTYYSGSTSTYDPYDDGPAIYGI